MSTILFGIPNCDTVKKARSWLEQHKVSYRFHDFRKDGLDAEQINRWCKHTDWENLLNRRSRTWRELDDADREGIDQAKAIRLMLQQPSLIKRPVLEVAKQLSIGFDPATYKTLFSS